MQSKNKKDVMMFLSGWRSYNLKPVVLSANVCLKSKFHFGYMDEAYDALIALKELTGRIDFGCEIQQNGRLCHMYRRDDSTQCCCKGCANSFGYISAIPINHLKYYVRHFNFALGYWRKDKGCILPRNRRSITCLTYACYSLYDKKSRKYKDRLDLRGLFQLENKMKHALNIVSAKYAMPWDEVEREVRRWKKV